MKTILIALDYEPTAQKVAEQGLELAKSLGAKCILMHVVVEAAYYSNAQYMPIMGFGGYSSIDFMELEELHENLKQKSQQFLDMTKEHLGHPELETYVTTGEVAESLLQAAKELKADILVIGCHSHAWMDTLVNGNVMAQVIRQATLPLYIIPK